MPAVACSACKQKMSSEAAVCPHCNARQADAPSSIADVKLSADEILAFVALDEASRAGTAEPAGLFATVIVPNPRTRGAARTTELVLTLACAPLLIAGLLPLAVARRATRGRRIEQMSGEAAATLTLAVAGGLGLASIVYEISSSGLVSAAIAAGEIVLLIARGVVRARSSARRDLMRLAKGD